MFNISYCSRYGQSQSEEKGMAGDKYNRSIKVYTYLRGPESASIEMPPFRPHFIKFSKTVFTYFETLTFRGTFTK
jgi:hypothetical protein